jgi:hypothetical protein
MTAKEALHRAIDEMDEPEARRWLAIVRPGEQEVNGAQPGERRSIVELIDEIFGDVPEEVWKRLPSSELIDDVVYGDPTAAI